MIKNYDQFINESEGLGLDAHTPDILRDMLEYEILKNEPSFDLVRDLIDHGAPIHDRYGKADMSLLHMTQDHEIARMLIQNGIPVDIRDSNGKTALHYAARTNKIDMLRELIQAGASLDAKDKLGHTPLLEAILVNTSSNSSGIEKNVEAIEMLLELGANVEARNVHDQNGIQVAVFYELTKILSILLRFGADPNSRAGIQEVTPLHTCVHYGDNTKIIEQLVAAGADLNARDAYGRTPLHHIASLSRPRSMKKLLELGADRTIQDDDGKTPWDYAPYWCRELHPELQP